MFLGVGPLFLAQAFRSFLKFFLGLFGNVEPPGRNQSARQVSVGSSRLLILFNDDGYHLSILDRFNLNRLLVLDDPRPKDSNALVCGKSTEFHYAARVGMPVFLNPAKSILQLNTDIGRSRVLVRTDADLYNQGRRVLCFKLSKKRWTVEA